MTLKKKLALLQGLQNEEEIIKDEIKKLKGNILDVELRQHNIAELRKKYSTLDFNNITPKQLNDLMINDFKQYHISDIEKQEIYNHNMAILAQVLEKTKKQTDRINSRTNFKSLEEVRNNINVNQQNKNCRNNININLNNPDNRLNNNPESRFNNKPESRFNDDIKKIEITGKSVNEFITGYDSEELEEHYDEEYLNALNNKIDKEYQFNLKILKTYCVFCHYRNIKLPSQDELDYIKEELEGWQFIPKEEFKNISYNETLYFLTIDNFKIILNEGNFKKNTKWGIQVYIKDKGIKTLNYLNPIFKQICEDDI